MENKIQSVKHKQIKLSSVHFIADHLVVKRNERNENARKLQVQEM